MKIIILCLSFFVSLNLLAQTNILILGDSLAEGYGLDEAMAFPRVVEKKLNDKKINVKVINGGVSGATSASGIQRLKWHLKKPVEILLLELGANDGLRGLSVPDTKKNLKEIIKFAKEKKVKVMLLGILMPPNYGEDYTKQFEKMYKQLASEEKIPFLPFLLDGVAGNPKLNLPDGIHPNQKGHEVIAEKVVQFLEKNI